MTHRTPSIVGAVLFSTTLAAACGAGQPNSVSQPPPAASVGSEPAPAEAEPAAPRLGTVTVQAQVNEQSVPAHVRFVDSSRQLEAETGESVQLQSGTQHIEVSITDPALIVDKPTQRLQVFVEPGQPASAVATFPWAKVQLNLLMGGRSQSGTPIRLLRNDKVVAEVKSGAPACVITPGKYEADVLLPGRTIRVRGLVILEGAVQTVPVRAQ